MSLTRLAVHRPVTTLMASLIVVLLGWVALTKLAIDLMPELTYPTISVSTLYEGAGPEIVEERITRPLEQTLQSVQGVEQVYSTTMEGSSHVHVRFRWDANLDTAVSDMRAKIEKMRKSLPEGVDPPYISRYNTSDSPIIFLGLSSNLDPIRLTKMAEKEIAPRLENVDGVARVRVRGATRREIQIQLNRRKLESIHMSVNQVVNALRRENVSQPAGNFEEGNVRMLIRSRGDFHSLEEIAGTVVRESEGAVVRVRDIADVVDGEEERMEHTRIDGKPGLLIYLYRQAGTNTVEVSDRVHAKVRQINRTLQNATLAVRIDRSEFIRSSIRNVRTSAFYGMGLAFVVLIVFLRSFRSTLVIGVSMPLSVLATFGLIYYKGFTLNMVSFGGLALGIGLLVDNSIVVLESIFRKLEEGAEPKSAAVEGTQEVASAIVASTLTTLIVFVPLLFIQGRTGIMLTQLAWVVSFSLFCSLLASLTLTPVLAAYWIRFTPAEETTIPASNGLVYQTTRKLHRMNHAILSGIENAYRGILRISIGRASIVTVALLALFAVSVGLTPRVGTEFMPKPDEGGMRVFGRMAPGIKLDKLDEQAHQLERTVSKVVNEDAETMTISIGGSADDASDWNRCWIRLKLTPRDTRQRNIEQLRKELEQNTQAIAGMKIRIYPTHEISLGSMLASGGGGDVIVEIRGHNLDAADEFAGRVEEMMKSIPGLVNVKVQKEDRRPEMAARIDRSKASLLGVSTSDITQTLETTIRGTDATIYREDGDEFKVLVRLQEDDREHISDIEQVGVETAGNRIMPLKNLIAFDYESAPLTIHRKDQQRIVQVSGDVEERDLGSVVADVQRELSETPAPPGFALNIAGDWEDQQESFRSLTQGLILAVVLMYMVMASQFESLRDPLLILISVPLGAIGVILMLVATGTSLNVQSYIGVIMLSGIVVNNAIVLIDYINRLRREEPETDITEIVMKAAVRRFRPILMTTLTTVLAMGPIALGWGEGGELQSPMARVVIGGMLSSTLITLLAIPLLSLAVHRSKQSRQAA